MEKIYEANKDVLKNPNYIYIGTKLTIPGRGRGELNRSRLIHPK